MGPFLNSLRHFSVDDGERKAVKKSPILLRRFETLRNGAYQLEDGSTGHGYSLVHFLEVTKLTC